MAGEAEKELARRFTEAVKDGKAEKCACPTALGIGNLNLIGGSEKCSLWSCERGYL
jgi:hypothetical protein